MVSGMLNDAKIKAAKPSDRTYKLSDSGQLYLVVTPAGGKHWRQNYTFRDSPKAKAKQKTLSHGSYPAMTLADARTARDNAKALLQQGIDPAVHRKQHYHDNAEARANTFEKVAREWYEKKRTRWSKVHARDVLRSLEENVFPAIGDVPINEIRAPRLLQLLTPIENRGAIETAHRVRSRMSSVFVYGIAAGIAETDPAASLGKALRPKPRSTKQPAITDLDAFRQMLRDVEAERCRANTKLGLHLLALTAVRPGELRHGRWSEIEDLDGAEPVWRIPSERMKGTDDRKAEEGGDHIVPLSRQSVEVLRALHRLTGDLELMFPGDRHPHRAMSENTLRALLIRAGYHQRHVPHGFRAAFSTIMNEKAVREEREGDRKIIDLMLAHVPENKVESAYNRAAFMERRREIAQEWADMISDGLVPPEKHLGKPIRFAATGPGRP